MYILDNNKIVISYIFNDQVSSIICIYNNLFIQFPILVRLFQTFLYYV